MLMIPLPITDAPSNSTGSSIKKKRKNRKKKKTGAGGDKDEYVDKKRGKNKSPCNKILQKIPKNSLTFPSHLENFSSIMDRFTE